jgi:outer membrane autotransporter protein
MSTVANLSLRARRLTFLLGGAAGVALLVGQPARAITINDDVAAATPGGVSNYWDQGNQYSNVVAIDIGLPGGFTAPCTGILINARTIVTAAHCFYDQNGGALAVSFNPNTTSNPNPQSAVSTTIIYSGWTTNKIPSNDIALLSLATPFPTVPVPRLLTANLGDSGFPQNGSVLVMVGYGGTGTGSNPTVPADGKRRVAYTQLGAYGSDLKDQNGQPAFSNQNGQPLFGAQFRNPQNAAQFNAFELSDNPPALQGGTRGGDSGGPLLRCPMGTPDQCSLSQLVLIGVLAAGQGPLGSYGEINGWTPINLFAAWIAQNNPERQVTANAGNFTWSNPAAWNDSVLGQTGFAPNYAIKYNQAEGTDYAQNYARYYQVTLRNPGTITLDMSPQIDTLTISGAQSQLILPAPFTLTTVLSTTLSNGTLTMRGGSLFSPEVLIGGGLFTGNGIICNGGNAGVCNTSNTSNTSVSNTGGTVMPNGTLTIQGNYTQSGSGVLAYQLSPTAASGTLTVTGTPTLGGALAATVTPGLYANSTPYMSILTANSVNGEFAEVTSSSVFLSAAATYNATSVDLTLNRMPFGAVPGLSSNQRTVGNALESAYSTNLTGPQADFYGNILASPTTNVLTQLSGETNAGAGQIAAFQLTNEFLLLMLNPFGLDRDGFGAAGLGALGGGAISRFAPERQASPEVAQAYAAVTPGSRAGTYWTPRWNVWAAAFGGANNTNGDPGGSGTHSFAARTAGIAAGLDYKVTPDTLIGFALAGGDTGWGLAQGLGGGHSDAFQAGLYGSQLFGPAYLSGALAFANYWTATSRSVVVASIDALNASFDAQSWAGRAEAGYKLAWAPVNLTPYAAVQAQSFRTPNFSEGSSSGSTLYALSYASHTGSVTRAELGTWLSNNYPLAGDVVAVLFGRAAWAHDWQNDLQTAPTFLTLPTASFIVNGAKAASDLAVVTAGAELRLAGGISLMGKFDGEFGAGTSTYAGTARVRYTW